MGEFLKRRYNILTLRIELLEQRRMLRFTLQSSLDGPLGVLGSWEVPAEAFGIATGGRGAEVPAFGGIGPLPEGLRSGIGDLLATRSGALPPLWVHLIKPYGALRFVPWERVLGAAFMVPVLMLPDFVFPPPSETSELLEVALCGSAPLHVEDHWVHEAVATAAASVLIASPRPTRLHIFTDHAIAPRLHERLAPLTTAGSEVKIHDYEWARPFFSPSERSSASGQLEADSLRSPWLRWMRATLRDEGVDVVHFACHGHLTRDTGSLLFAQSPIERTEQYLAGPVGAAELGTFMTQVGAWSAAFTTIRHDDGVPGIRALADEIAQARPGPMIMHDHDRDPDGTALREAYSFVYHPEPQEAPRSDALFLYCQPYRVRGADPSWHGQRLSSLVDIPLSLHQDVGAFELIDLDVGPSDRGPSPLEPLLRGARNAPTWVSATARFAEQVKLDLLREQARGVVPEPVIREHTAIAMSTLAHLQASVARLAGTLASDLDRQGKVDLPDLRIDLEGMA